jgi:hypothetical protein
MKSLQDVESVTRANEGDTLERLGQLQTFDFGGWEGPQSPESNQTGFRPGPALIREGGQGPRRLPTALRVVRIVRSRLGSRVNGLADRVTRSFGAAGGGKS